MISSVVCSPRLREICGREGKVKPVVSLVFHPRISARIKLCLLSFFSCFEHEKMMRQVVVFAVLSSVFNYSPRRLRHSPLLGPSHTLSGKHSEQRVDDPSDPDIPARRTISHPLDVQNRFGSKQKATNAFCAKFI